MISKSKKNISSKLFFKLTLHLELFTHIVPVPVAIYFTLFTGGFETTEDLLLVALIGILAGSFLVLAGTYWRYLKIKPLMLQMQKLESGKGLSPEEAIELKLNLLKHPFQEAKIIFLRWFVGVPATHLIFIVIRDVRPMAHLALPFLLLTIIPISYIAYLFISENIIRPFLQSSYFREIHLSLKDIPKMSYFKRLILAVFSLVIMPISLLGYLLFAITRGYIVLENPLFHIFIIAASFILPLLIAAYSIAKALKNGLADIDFVLKKLSDGDLSVSSVASSADEFGEQAHHLGTVVEKLNKTYEEIADLNTSLESKVAKRTEVLKKTIEEIKILKVQQDGDYFLTSLLLKPLSFSHVSSKHIEVNFFIRQKKRFTFRKWSEEIGGDLCCSDEMILSSKKYLVFANADAMGKSMQGAGGALVFGTVFQALIQRSKIVSELQKTTPELWLRNAFIEIHKIFETFDGSMLISSVLGLVDVETGFVYFMNSEHPDPILLRNGKASFVPDVHPFRKFGTTGVRGLLFVQTFQLEAGDTLWIGSDGKDDLNLAQSGSPRIINSDETLFLRILEDAKGEYNSLVSKLEEQGDITDDLSLLSISYKKDLKKDFYDEADFVNESKQLRKSGDLETFVLKAEEYKTKHSVLPPSVHKWLSEVYLIKKDYRKAARCAEEYINEHPQEERMYLLSCIAYKRIKNYKRALQIAESLRMRDPNNIDYINQLIEILIILKQKRKAEKLLVRVLESNPDNKKALRLKKQL